MYSYVLACRKIVKAIHFFVFLSEPERKLLLTEKCGGEIGTDKSCAVTAVPDFHFIGTMNPGGDYGKKEVGIMGSIVVHFIGTMNPGGDYGKKEVGIMGIIVVHSLVHTRTGIMDECASQCARAHGTVPHMINVT
jgi:hypothetical protein